MTSGSDDTVRILALVGSLRRGSYNRMLYEAAVELAPAGMTFTEADLRSLPLYDDDVRLEQDYPEPARRLRADIAAADGLLIVSPEYNHTVPGVLQNAIDWASRPPDQPFKGKPVAIMGASTGRLGTVEDAAHPADHARLPGGARAAQARGDDQLRARGVRRDRAGGPEGASGGGGADGGVRGPGYGASLRRRSRRRTTPACALTRRCQAPRAKAAR